VRLNIRYARLGCPGYALFMGWLEDAFRDPLASIGFRKRAGAIFTAEVADEVLGWVGLNRASEHQPKGQFEVNPVIGIRLQRVEREVARLGSLHVHAYIPPTASSPLGYLIPEARYRFWILKSPDGPPAAVQSVAEAIETYGLPFIKSNSSPEAVVQLLDRRRLQPPEVYRIAVIRALLGRAADGDALLSEAAQGLGPRKDPAAYALREFAEKFRESPPN